MLTDTEKRWLAHDSRDPTSWATAVLDSEHRPDRVNDAFIDARVILRDLDHRRLMCARAVDAIDIPESGYGDLIAAAMILESDND